MIQARIQHGVVELNQPIPSEWEGQWVTITPADCDPPLEDLESHLAALDALGPMEYEPGEEQEIANALAELDRTSLAAMKALAGIER